MKSEKRLKGYETVWTCDFCGQEFKNKKESDRHELICDKNTKYQKLKNNSIFTKIAKISKITWFISMGVFLILAFVLNKIDPEYKNIFSQISLPTTVIIGICSFLLMVFTSAIDFSFVEKKQKNVLIKIIIFILSIIFFPFFIIKKQNKVLFGFFILLPIWGLGIIFTLLVLGIIRGSTPVVGNSMNPTILDKENVDLSSFTILNKLFFKPQKGDIVTFESGRTVDPDGQIASYIKRIVATSGDEVSIRDGFLYVNNQLIKESYTVKPRSTFGGSFLPDCKTIKIPDDYYFVLGDNRKRSKDSREVGLVSINEIESILPIDKQDKFKDRLRNASNDGVDHGLPSFDLDDYYQRINKIREDNNLKPLKKNEKLEKAAIARAKSIIENNEIDFKNSENKSKYPYEKAIKEAGYYNIISGENQTTGYYDSEELSNYWLEYKTKENILNKDFQDTGIGAYIGKIDGCEIQVIVQEFGGYVPPNYSKTTIDSWKNAVDSLNSVIPSWEKTKGWNNINQDDLSKLLDLMYREKKIASNILFKMESGKWLSDEENRSIDEYENLSKQSSALADKLNGN